MPPTKQSRCRIVVLISGSGSNLQALIDGEQNKTLPIEITGVISNRPEVYGLTRAAQAEIPTQVLDHKQFTDRLSFDRELADIIDSYQPDLVVLAGFMRILSPEFVRHFQGKMLNIHPSLLPKYQGLHTHKRALEAGDEIHGVTVHFVTEELDGGPAIIQAIVPIETGDDETTLAKKVQQQEHIIYPQAVAWFAQQKLKMVDDSVLLNGEPLPENGYQVDTRHPSSLEV